MNVFPNLFYTTLDFLLEGDGIESIFKHPEVILFRTVLGLNGSVMANSTGDYEVQIGDEIIYTMEKSVYDLINFGFSPPPLSFYVPLLLMTWNSPLHDKSKLIIGKILNSLLFLESRGYVDFELQEYGPLSFFPNFPTSFPPHK